MILSSKSKYRGLMRQHTYAELESQIREAVTAKFQQGHMQGEASFQIIDGFSNTVLQEKVGPKVGLVIGGTTVPCVLVLGHTSGRIYSFALLALLPYLGSEPNDAKDN